MKSMHTKLPLLYPLVGPVIDDRHEALFYLVDTLLQHGSDVEGNVGQGVGRSDTGPSRVGPSHTKNPHRSLDPTRSRDHIGHAKGSKCHVMPHHSTTYGNICYGPSS